MRPAPIISGIATWAMSDAQTKNASVVMQEVRDEYARLHRPLQPMNSCGVPPMAHGRLPAIRSNKQNAAASSSRAHPPPNGIADRSLPWSGAGPPACPVQPRINSGEGIPSTAGAGQAMAAECMRPTGSQASQSSSSKHVDIELRHGTPQALVAAQALDPDMARRDRAPLEWPATPERS